MERIYLIKNPNVWMLDELIVFSRHVPFTIIFFRRPDVQYRERLNQLKENGIEIVCCPFVYRFSVKKALFTISFILKNVSCFFSSYSFVVGVKSIWWFFWLDDSYFKSPASIHAQFATQPALVSHLISKYHQNIDYYFTFHAYDIFFHNRWFIKLVNSSKKCFSISKYNLDYVMRKYKGLNKSKLDLSRLGAFSIDVVPSVKYKPGDFKLGFISWFVEKKGIRYLLEAMRVIASETKGIKLVMAGDGPLRNEIEQFIAKNNLGESITYIGRLNAAQKETFYSEVDALILPAITLHNDKDGIPVVLMEAIAFGLPLISTNISGIPEICIDHYNGLLVPEKDTDALVKAAYKLYNSELLLRRFSENSLQLAKEYRIERNSYSKLEKLEWIP